MANYLVYVFPFIITAKLYFNHHGNFLGGDNVEEGTIHYRRVKMTGQLGFTRTDLSRSFPRALLREQTS